MVSITVGLSVLAAFFYYNAWQGYRWRRSKSESSLRTMMSTDGLTDEALSGANQVRLMILYPGRFKLIGHVLSIGAVVAAAIAFSTWSP